MKQRKTIPFQFVLDRLEAIAPSVKPMFGCFAIYRDEKILLILRERKDHPEDNGIWVCTQHSHHESLKKDFPILRSIGVFGTPITSWQVLPSSDPDFESFAESVCDRILKNDPRIGKIPEKKKSRKN